MIRITKLTDYAVVIIAFMANDPLRQYQAKELADQTHIKAPTVSKLLKLLTKSKFLVSSRGAMGGYRLTIDPKDLSLMTLMEALEGPFAITDCNLGHDHCATETQCALKTPWLQINKVLSTTLASIKLSDLVNPKALMSLTAKKSPKAIPFRLNESSSLVVQNQHASRDHTRYSQ